MTLTMQPASRRRALLLLALVWLAATAWLRPLAVPDEGRYVGVAWEMLRSGNWLVPTLAGFEAQAGLVPPEAPDVCERLEPPLLIGHEQHR